ncbi:MAG: PEP-CTERM sorting domain-containing protein [Gemmatimonadaceae bacterium]
MSVAKYNIHANYDSYVGGSFNYNNSTVGNTPYVGNGCCDTRFLEYATGPAVPPTTAAPEPATTALLAAGLVGIAGVMKRRRRLAEVTCTYSSPQ